MVEVEDGDNWFVPTGDEVHKVAFVAHERVIKKNNLGWKDRAGLVTDNFKDYGMNLFGAWGEYYVAKYLNIMWGTGLEDIKGADLITQDGRGIQVKTTTHEYGGLMHRPNEIPTDFHVLVISTDRPFSFKIAGWLTGDEARDEKYFDNPILRNGRPPCYYVSQDKLNDIKTLKTKIYGAK